MEQTIKNNPKPIEKFKCPACGTIIETDKYDFFELASLSERKFELHLKCHCSYPMEKPYKQPNHHQPKDNTHTKKILLIILGILFLTTLLLSETTTTKKIIILFLAFTAFYKHGTEDNLWFKLGKWSKKIF